MSKLLSIVILIMPWIVIPLPIITEQMRTPKATLFDLTCISLIIMSLFKGIKFLYTNKYLGYLVLCIFGSFWFNFYLPYTIQGTMKLWSIEPMIHFILGLWAVLIILSSFEREDFIRVARAICWSAVCISIYGAMQVSRFLDPTGNSGIYFEPMQNRFTGLIGHYHLAGCYIAMALPLFTMFFKQKKYIVGFIITLIGVFLSTADMATIASGVSLFIIALLRLKHNKKLIAILIILALLLTAFYLYINFNVIKDLSIFSRRIYLWGEVIKQIKPNPLFGRGIGVFKSLQIKDGPTLALEAHNDYLELVVQFGLLGLFLLGLVIINTLRKFNYKKDNIVGFAYYGSFIAFLIVMFGSFPLEQAPLALVGLLAWCGCEKM